MNDIVKLKFSNDSELKYTNFSIVISKSRGLAFYTAEMQMFMTSK